MLEFPAHHLDSHHISNLNLCVSNAKVFLSEGTTGSLQNTRAGESVNRDVCCHRAGRLLGCLSRMSLHVPHWETPGFLRVFSGVIAASVVPSVSREGCASSPLPFPPVLCFSVAASLLLFLACASSRTTVCPRCLHLPPALQWATSRASTSTWAPTLWPWPHGCVCAAGPSRRL